MVNCCVENAFVMLLLVRIKCEFYSIEFVSISVSEKFMNSFSKLNVKPLLAMLFGWRLRYCIRKRQI